MQILDFLTSIHTVAGEPDRLPKACAALILAGSIGVATGLVNPLFWYANDMLFGRMGDKLDRLERARADLVFRGFILSSVVLFTTLLLVYFIKNEMETMPYYGFVEIFALSLLLSSGGLWAATLRLHKAMEGKAPVSGAFLAIARGTRTNLSMADNYTITRVSIGFLAKIFDKATISPLFWYFLGGIPWAFLYASFSFLSWRFGKSGFSKGLGVFPQAVDKIMGFVPNLVSGIFVSVAALFTPTAGLFRSILCLFRLKGRAPYEQGGFPVSAMAGALHISLGGPTQDITGSTIKSAWVGPEGATAQNDYHHLRRAIYIAITANILFVVLILAVYTRIA